MAGPVPAFAAAASVPSVRRARSSASCAQRPSMTTSPPASREAAAPASTPSSARGEPLLLRAARGEDVERPPVWLMRQAGRYMAAFRAYSDVMAFRARSEDADIAFELSMQPRRAFKTDGVIMFSDILTPLPAVGVDFDIVPGTGPVITTPLRSLAAADALAEAVGRFSPEDDLPFVADVLARLRAELADSDATTLGFVGAPFTLAAYAIEGGTRKTLGEVKRLMYGGAGGTGGQALRRAMRATAQLSGRYAAFQARAGAQVVQFFDSWAHHLTPAQYEEWAAPAARRAVQVFREEAPGVPAVFFAHGSAGKLRIIREAVGDLVDVVAVDWGVDMSDVRSEFGVGKVLQGNVDPEVLRRGSEEEIRRAVRDCVDLAGRKHVLNLGHGVIKDTPEHAVGIFCDEARRIIY